MDIAPVVRKKPLFGYGLNVFFTEKDAGLSYGEAVSSTPCAVRAPEGVKVLTLAEAAASPQHQKWVTTFLQEGDIRHADIASWHRTHAGLGMVVIVPPMFASAEPIRIDLELADAHRVENVVIAAGEGSRITVVEHLRSAHGAGRAMRSTVTDVIAHDHSHVTYISLQNFAENVTDLSLRRGIVRKNATLRWVECLFGGAFSQSFTSTELRDEGAATESLSQFFGHGNQRFDLSQNVRHLASRTRSNLSTGGALTDTAKTIYRGLVRIEKGTRGCSGHQKERTLLLSDKAEIDAVPNLEIASEDVQCGHSASVGRIDKEKLFYLLSRGLDEAAARKLLVEGFFAPIVRDMEAAGLEDHVQCVIDERIENAAKI